MMDWHKRAEKDPLPWSLAVLATLAPGLGSCGMGSMHLKSERYFAVSNGENTNYFRLRAYANTKLGVAEFRSGWYPKDAVDALFGDVGESGSIAAREAQQKIEHEFADASVQMASQWTAAVLNSAADSKQEFEARLRRIMDARRYLVTAPVPGSDGEVQFQNATTMEYDVSRPLWLRHANEKLVFTLSSNPDEVIGKIAAFANEQETAVTVNRLADALQAAIQDRVDSDAASAQVSKETSNRLQTELASTITDLADATKFSADPAKDKRVEGTRIKNALRSLVQRVQTALSANGD